MLKFRSMRRGAAGPRDLPPLAGDAAPGGVEGEDRRTPVGRFCAARRSTSCRSSSTSLRGDMSLVGPRPERPEFVERFAERVRRYDERHRVKSGITGWAQVNGLRGQTSLADRVEWDNYYIQNWSLLARLQDPADDDPHRLHQVRMGELAVPPVA